MCPISRHVTTLAQKTHLCFCAATVAETKNPFGLFDRAALEITASKPRKKATTMHFLHFHLFYVSSFAASICSCICIRRIDIKFAGGKPTANGFLWWKLVLHQKFKLQKSDEQYRLLRFRNFVSRLEICSQRRLVALIIYVFIKNIIN